MANGWGGARAGAGRKPNSVNRLAQSAIKKAEAAKVHPVDFLLQCVADKKLPTKERSSAAAAILPYVACKLSIAEISVRNETDTLSTAELQQRLEVLDGLILEHQPKVINGTAKRVEVEAEVLE